MFKKKFFLFLSFVCLVVSFAYRSRSYVYYPPIADTFDEFAAGWLGLSLLRTGIPASWSFIPFYKSGVPKDATLVLVDTKIGVNGRVPAIGNYSSFPKPVSLTKEFDLDGYRSHFDVVSPYLEQPPLGGLMIALPLYYSGLKNFSQVNLSLLRRPFVFLGVIATALIIWLSYLWYGRGVSLVSGFIYATVPTIIYGSRLALPENLLTAVFLFELIFLTYYGKSKNSIFVILALALSFISPLIKPFGLAAILIGAGYFLLVEKNIKYSCYFILAGAASMLFYILYGLFYDKNTFLAVLSYQGSRFFAGPIIFLLKIMVPRVTRIFLDGWIFFGWISLFFLAFTKNRKKHIILLIAAFSYITGLALFGGEDYGWYRLPLYPYLAIAAGYLIVRIIKKPDFFSSMIFVLTALAGSMEWGMRIYNWTAYISFFRIFILIIGAVLLSTSLFKDKRLKFLQSAVILVLFIFSIILNTRIINDSGYVWEHMGDKSSLILNRN